MVNQEAMGQRGPRGWPARMRWMIRDGVCGGCCGVSLGVL